MSKQRGQKVHNIKTGERYAMIPAKVVESEAFRSLSASGCQVLIASLCQFVNTNANGNISLTAQMFPWMSKDTLFRARKELVAKGLLRVTREGQFS